MQNGDFRDTYIKTQSRDPSQAMTFISLKSINQQTKQRLTIAMLPVTPKNDLKKLQDITQQLASM